MADGSTLRLRRPAGLGIRLLTVCIVVPSYIGLVALGEAIWAAAVVWSAIMAGYEYFNLMEKGGYPTNSKLGMALIAILIVRYSGAFSNIPLAVVITWGMIALLASALFSRRTPFLTWLSTAGGSIYIGSCLALLVPIRQGDAGFWWLMFLMFSTYMSDAGAYLVGSLLGRHKMWPELSPKKTWEGLIGALVLGPLFGLIMIYLSNLTVWSPLMVNLSESLFWQRPWIQEITALDVPSFSPLPISYGMGLVLAVGIALLGQLGDLVVSMWKRHVGTKDSGTLFRGHGGMLDRVDSLLFSTPLVFSLILLL